MIRLRRALGVIVPLRRFREPPPRVAVVRLSGVIGSMGGLRRGMTLDGLADSLERAFSVPEVCAVALAVNSPGGSPVQSSLIAARIRALAEEKELPVIAFAEDAAASGGYWLACAADEIYADAASIVGSIGVISAGFGLQELIGRFGVERRVHTSGSRKGMLDPFRPESPDDVAHLEAIQADIHDAFKDHVRARRGERLKADEETLFSGAFWTGRQALDMGLVDGIGEMRHVLRDRFGDTVRLIKVGPRRSWLRRLRGGGARGLARAAVAAAEERLAWMRVGL